MSALDDVIDICDAAIPWVPLDRPVRDEYASKCSVAREELASLRQRVEDYRTILLHYDGGLRQTSGHGWCYAVMKGIYIERFVDLESDADGLPILTPESRAALRASQEKSE